MRRLLRVLLAATMLLGGLVVATTAAATPASALCSPSAITGDWRNINTSTPAMSRVIVETCQPVTTCSGGVCSTRHDAGVFMTPFGRCHPTDCNWGRRQADFPDGSWIRTIHNFGFKTAHVWARTESHHGRTYLRLWVFNDFTPADGRADYVTDEWFLQ
jgi:hypothetical protein